MWYFIGMVISRIGSIFVEDTLKKIKIKGKPYLVFADYKQYTTASEANPFIATLSETNNTYRTTISLLICIGAFYFYDSFIYDWIIKKCAVGNKLKDFGVSTIFRFILTHPDMDHMDGMKSLFDSFSSTLKAWYIQTV